MSSYLSSRLASRAIRPVPESTRNSAWRGIMWGKLRLWCFRPPQLFLFFPSMNVVGPLQRSRPLSRPSLPNFD